MSGDVMDLAEDLLDGVPVTMAWVVGVPTEEACDESDVGVGAVGEVSEIADYG